MENTKIIWVKKEFDKTDWEDFYKHNPSYCKLGEIKMGSVVKKIAAGFCMAFPEFEYEQRFFQSNAPFEIGLEEQRIVDNYRKGNHIFPTPFQEKKEVSSKKEIDIFEKFGEVDFNW